jgi:hypothetical protein
LQEKVIAYKARTEKTEQLIAFQDIKDFLLKKIMLHHGELTK